MKAVVILSWDAASGILEYVDVNGGMGGVAERHAVSQEAAEGISEQLAGHVLPRTADLEAEGEFVLIDSVSRARVARCAVKAVGRPDDRRFELRDREQRTVVATIPATGLGVTDTALANAVNRLEYLYAEHLTPPGCWLGAEGGIGAWLAARRHAAARTEAERAKDRTFINPYTFVPLPETIQRGQPGGHHWLAPGRLSGAFTVTWEFATPFQAPEGASGTTVLRLPGASVKGAVRSVHEALAGGCLRVFDSGFIPSYRDHAQVRGTDWTLAVVAKATGDGQPLTVTLCDEVVWVGAGQLRQACGDSLASGSRVSIRGGEAQPRLGRKELPRHAAVASGGEWVVLVTDSGTRQPRKGTYFLACGRIGGRTAEVSEAAWRAFRIAVAGARDLQPGAREREGRGTGENRPTILVRFGDQPIGRRRVVTGRLWEGDVIWVRTRDDGTSVTAEEVSLAALWRHPGWDAGQDPAADPARWSAARRVPDALLACRDPQSLCPTCRVFGSAEAEARLGDERARQRAYAGHVRFGDACGEQPVELEPVQRAPLGAPRPGAGQFYLAYTDPRPASSRDRKPTREWGSDPDAGLRRPLRGRKFYWHADPARQDPPRHIAREHQKTRGDQTESEFVATRHLARAGTTLRQRITFDNLSRAELGGLLASFEPQRVLQSPPGRRLLLHLGGGKPLGLGSCTATVSGLRAWTAAGRYGGAPGEAPDPDGYLREFADSCAPEIREKTWPALAAALADGTADPARVWYPPGGYWPDQQRDQKTFDEPFAFFTASSGMYIKPPGGQRPLIPLPDPAGGDQSLPIKTSKDLK